MVDTTDYDDYSFGTGRVVERSTVDPEVDPEYLVLYRDHRVGWCSRWFFYYELEPHEPSDEEVVSWTIAYLEGT